MTIRTFGAVVAALVTATASVVHAPLPGAAADQAPGLCAMSMHRGEIPGTFPIEACVDGSSIWLRNSLEVPIRFETSGDADEPVTVELNQTPAAVVTRALEDRDGLLLPGDLVRVPIGSGEASVELADTDAGGAYVLATTVETFLPVGAGGEVLEAAAGLVSELSDVMVNYGNCLAGKNWLQQAGCRAILVRDVGFAVGRATVAGVGSATVSLIASVPTYLRFLDAQPEGIRRVLGGDRSLVQEAGDPAPPLDEAALRNAPVPPLCDNPAGTMADGEFVFDGADFTGATGIVAAPRFTTDGWSAVAVGDLTGDDVPEAALVLYCHWGGSGSDSRAVVYSPGPTVLAEVPIDGAAGVRIADGGLDVVGLTGNGDDPSCCPSVVEARRFVLKEGSLVEADRDTADEGDPVSSGTWGPLTLGSSYADAAYALNVPLDVTDSIGGAPLDFTDRGAACVDAVPVGDSSFSILGSGARSGVAYIDDQGVRTDAGVGPGSTVAEVRAAYGEQAREEDNIYQEQPDLYVGGDPAVKGSPGVRFIADEQGTVYLMMVGVQPYLGLAEGCA